MMMPVLTEDRMMSAAGARLAGMLAARLCHDLSGPLAGLLVALELAEDEAGAAGATDDVELGEALGEALGVALDGARQMAARLRLLRAAWGAEPGPLEVAEVAALADGLINRKRLELDFSALAPGPRFAPAGGQAVLGMLLLAASALPGGGQVMLAGRADEEVLLRVSGPGAAWPAGLAAALAGGMADGVADDPADDAAGDPAGDAAAEPRLLPVQMLISAAARAGRTLRLLPPSGPGTVGPPPLLLGAPQR